jgi:hypothetical protein
MEVGTALLDAIRAQPAPPCEQFNCFCRTACAKQKLACSSFEKYIESGRVVPPSATPDRETYARYYYDVPGRKRVVGRPPQVKKL